MSTLQALLGGVFSFVRRIILERTRNATAHVGPDRWETLTKAAINISYAGGKQITASQFLKKLIDEYAPAAEAKMVAEAKGQLIAGKALKEVRTRG
ncbi:hypothetical protein [Serratia proteamaculans]|uniref:hypothetical protein n=1 Tax=Serratia proteamaculans TaxID=28151 RepID=UPI003CFF0677